MSFIDDAMKYIGEEYNLTAKERQFMLNILAYIGDINGDGDERESVMKPLVAGCGFDEDDIESLAHGAVPGNVRVPITVMVQKCYSGFIEMPRWIAKLPGGDYTKEEFVREWYDDNSELLDEDESFVDSIDVDYDDAEDV